MPANPSTTGAPTNMMVFRTRKYIFDRNRSYTSQMIERPAKNNKERNLKEVYKFELQSETVVRILPDKLYKPVARIIGLDVDIKEKLAKTKKIDYKKLYKGVKFLSQAIQAVSLEKDSEEEQGSSLVEPPSPRRKPRDLSENPYFTFLEKSEREQVRWSSKYLPPETEKEKGLVKRADEITNQICAEFCDYMDELGGYDSPLFKQEVVKELFQIEFDTHAAKSLLIRPKYINIIPQELADFKNRPTMSFENTLKNNIQWDVKAEQKLPDLYAFNRKLPKKEQWRPPRNMTKSTWKPENYPKDIITMENVWDGILHLKSVQDYCKWIADHPQVNKPKYLKKKQMFNVEQLKKICHDHKTNAENKLPEIEVKKLISKDYVRSSSCLPEDLKIKL